MSDKPTRFDWMKSAREIRDSRTEPSADDSLSAQLVAELGAQHGDDPINDRAEEAQQWCDLIMRSEGRERLLGQYFSTDSDWLWNRLHRVLDDVMSYHPSDKPLFVHTVLGHAHEPEHGMYGGPPGIGFGTGLGLSEPVYNLGGVVLGVIASLPMIPTAFSLKWRKWTPADMHGWLKFDKREFPVEAGNGTGRGLHNICDWHIAKNCQERRRFVLAFPLANYIIYYVTCYPCAGELAKRI